MRQIILTLALASLASLFSFEAGAKPVPKLAEKAKADDLAALQGEWVVASVVAPEGVQLNAEQTLKSHLERQLHCRAKTVTS